MYPQYLLVSQHWVRAAQPSIAHLLKRAVFATLMHVILHPSQLQQVSVDLMELAPPLFRMLLPAVNAQMAILARVAAMKKLNALNRTTGLTAQVMEFAIFSMELVSAFSSSMVYRVKLFRASMKMILQKENAMGMEFVMPWVCASVMRAGSVPLAQWRLKIAA